MMKMPQDSRGFSIPEVLLSLVIISVVGFTGWFVYHSKQVANKALAATNSATPIYKNKASTKATTTLSTQTGYSFSYPNTWATVTHIDGVSDANRSSIIITSKDLATSTEGAGFQVTAGALMYMLAYDTKATTPTEYLKNTPHMQHVHSVTVAGQAATQYSAQWESSPTLVTVIVKDGKAYQILLDYANQAALQSYHGDYDALVGSFRLN